MCARRSTSGLNMLVGVDKPLGITSHDVVARLRRALGERRIGHAGTLDPLASGVMILGVGQATRLLGMVTCDEKEYVARLCFGRETTTDDAEGQTRIRAAEPADVLDEGFARASMSLLTSMTSQVPPGYSAISVNGVRAYVAERKGEHVELQKRPISVREATLVGLGRDDVGEAFWDVRVSVSKGTYVRALARDLGRALGSACHVGALRRMRSGAVGLGSCVPLESIEQGATPTPLDPVAVLGLRSLEIGDNELASVRMGKWLACPPSLVLGQDERACLTHGGRLYALASREGQRLLPRTVLVDGIDGICNGARDDS